MPSSDKARGYSATVHLGNAGEHLVMAHLLALGFQAFMADRGNPAFDISVVDGAKHSLIRVKTTRADSVFWSRKKSGITFLHQRKTGDYCCIVDLRSSVASAQIYVVPTATVQVAIDAARKEWNAGAKRDGNKRVDSLAQRLWLNGQAERRAWEGFRVKWRQYLEAWDQLRASNQNPRAGTAFAAAIATAAATIYSTRRFTGLPIRRRKDWRARWTSRNARRRDRAWKTRKLPTARLQFGHAQFGAAVSSKPQLVVCSVVATRFELGSST
jgi:hypothetical protein